MKAKNILNSVLLSAILIGLGACAKENSKEEIERETRQRAEERLNPATGTFNGYIKSSRGERIPVSIEVYRRSLSDEAQLSATMGLGLLGGTTARTEDVTYDWGTGELTASFHKETMGPSNTAPINLQLKGIVKDHVLSDVTLKAATSGMYKIELTERPTLDASTGSDRSFTLTFGTGARATMTITRNQGDVAAPANIDVPFIPNLKGNLLFESQGSSQIPFSNMIYDPLTGIMDALLSNGTSLRFTGVSLPGESTTSELSVLLGSLFQSGQQITSVKAVAGGGAVSSEAPTYFRGTMTFPAGSNAVVASLEPLFQNGNNPTDYPIPIFPVMVLRVNLCGAQGGSYNFMTTALNQIDGSVQFHSQDTGRLIDLKGKWSAGMTRFKGQIIYSGNNGRSTNFPLALHSSDRPSTCGQE